MSRGLGDVYKRQALARRLERSGADAVVAEGMESGGHVGDTTTMALVPQIVDSVNIPVSYTHLTLPTKA